MSDALDNVTNLPPANSSTLRVRRHRKRRRAGMWLITLEMPTAVIEGAIARGLLKRDASTEPWALIQGVYSSQLSDAALDWLVNGGVIAREQRGDAGAIFRSISKWLERARPCVTDRWEIGAAYGLRSSSGNLAKLAASRRASSLVGGLAADRRPGSSSK